MVLPIALLKLRNEVGTAKGESSPFGKEQIGLAPGIGETQGVFFYAKDVQKGI